LPDACGLTLRGLTFALPPAGSLRLRPDGLVDFAMIDARAVVFSPGTEHARHALATLPFGG
jgi:hypothetical protein